MDSREMLRANVDDIARQIAETDFSDCYGEDANVLDWVEQNLDVEYVVSGNGEYLGARILCCVGGPMIWVDTRTKEVQGSWGGYEYSRSYTDGMGLDDTMAQYWARFR